MKICSIPDCGAKLYALGWCKKHHQRNWRHGDPLKTSCREPGTGTQDPKGYWRTKRNGKVTMQHVEIAERALGRKLPAGAQVHHANENTSDNQHENLVICPSKSYHALLHVRLRAMKACGNPNWRKCTFCKQYDAPDNLRFLGRNQEHDHKECSSRYRRELAARRAA